MGQNIAGQVYNRLTEGEYLPLTETRKNRYGKAWFAIPGGIVALYVMAYVSSAYPESEFLAYLMTIIIVMGFWTGIFVVLKGFLPKAVSATITVARTGKHAAAVSGRKMQDHGWPTWRDAWGDKGRRPGGSIRGLMRGYLRLWLVALALGVLTMPLDSGALLAMVTIIGGFFALPAAVLLWHCRVTDFDSAKGWLVTAFLWKAIDWLPWTNGGKVRAYPSMAERLGTDQFDRSSWDPRSASHHPPTR